MRRPPRRSRTGPQRRRHPEPHDPRAESIARVHRGGAPGHPPPRRRGASGTSWSAPRSPRRAPDFLDEVAAPVLDQIGQRLDGGVGLGGAGAHGDRRVPPGARLAARRVRSQRRRAAAGRRDAAGRGARDGRADGGGQRGGRGMGRDLPGSRPAGGRPAERGRGRRDAARRSDQRRSTSPIERDLVAALREIRAGLPRSSPLLLGGAAAPRHLGWSRVRRRAGDRFAGRSCAPCCTDLRPRRWREA